jgi:hypothetical protein
MRSYLLSLQFAFGNSLGRNRAFPMDFMIYSHHANAYSQSHGVQSMLLDKMEEIVIIWSRSGGCWWETSHLPFFEGVPDFLKLATIYDLRGYVGTKLTGKGQRGGKERATGLLQFLLPDNNFDPNRGIPLVSIEMVSLLLERGADPNGSCGSRTPWETTLAHFSSYHFHPGYDLGTLDQRYVEIMEKLVLAGADPQAVLIHQANDSSSRNAISIVETSLLPKYPSEAGSLLRALKCAMSKSTANGKRPRDEVDVAENQAKRAQVHSYWSLIWDISRNMQRLLLSIRDTIRTQYSSSIREDPSFGVETSIYSFLSTFSYYIFEEAFFLGAPYPDCF